MIGGIKYAFILFLHVQQIQKKIHTSTMKGGILILRTKKIDKIYYTTILEKMEILLQEQIYKCQALLEMIK